MRALYAGSFDPPTLGHLDIIRRAAVLVDELVVGIGVNPVRQPLMSPGMRRGLLVELCSDLTNVTVSDYIGATIIFAGAKQVTVLVRGLRGPEDWPREAALAEANRHQGIDTLFLATRPALTTCSGSLVRELHEAGLDTSPFVPTIVAAALASL